MYKTKKFPGPGGPGLNVPPPLDGQDQYYIKLHVKKNEGRQASLN